MGEHYGVKLKRDFPSLYEFLGIASPDWDYEFPNLRIALSTHLATCPDTLQVLADLHSLLENIEPYKSDLHWILNPSIFDTDIRGILRDGILKPLGNGPQDSE
jgi:hypothetical protein